MPDVFQEWGNDLGLSPTGDLAAVDGTERGEQKIIRRLMTSKGEYIWHPEYGAGVPARVGTVLDRFLVEGVIRSQIFQEAAVARSPQPAISAEKIPDGVFVRIRYGDAETGQQLELTFDVSP